VEAVLFIGLQASGKSTFYKERFFVTHLRLSLDMLRTRHRLNVLLQACIQTQQRFVVDNTNLEVSERALYIQQAKAAQFKITGYFFEPDIQRSLLWNSQRTGKERVPDLAILGSIKRLERPTGNEGFDTIYTVTLTTNGQFEVVERLT